MNAEATVESLFQALVSGDRRQAEHLIADARSDGMSAEEAVTALVWPALDMTRKLVAQGQMTALAHRYAMRLLRTFADRLQAEYQQAPRQGRTVLFFCGCSVEDDLSGQIVADLTEAGGCTVYFGGSGVAADEIIAAVGEQRPDALVLISSSMDDRPGMVEMIERIREIGACPDMSVVVGGGMRRARAAGGVVDHWGGDGRDLVAAITNPTVTRKRAAA